MNNDIDKKIIKMYEQVSYSDGYGGDIWSTVIILVVMLSLIGYYTIMNTIKPLKRNWKNVRCDPEVIPFSGLIYKEPGLSIFDSTKKNAEYCANIILTDYSSKFTKPIDDVANMVTSTFTIMGNSVNAITGVLATIREYASRLVEQILLKTTLFTIPLLKFVYNIKSVFNKVIGILIASMYGMMTNLAIVITTLRAIPQTVGIIIAILYGTGWALISFFFTSFLGWPLVLTATILLAILAIYLYYINPVINEALSDTFCFDPKTKVKLQDGSIVLMKDIPLNAKLKNGTTVQAIMNISNLNKNGKQREQMYSISGGEDKTNIIVSGSHLIYDPNTKTFVKVQDVKVQDIKNKIKKITDVKHSVLCCLITSDHTIPIGNSIFHDWEDNNGSSAKYL